MAHKDLGFSSSIETLLFYNSLSSVSLSSGAMAVPELGAEGPAAAPGAYANGGLDGEVRNSVPLDRKKSRESERRRRRRKQKKNGDAPAAIVSTGGGREDHESEEIDILPKVCRNLRFCQNVPFFPVFRC